MSKRFITLLMVMLMLVALSVAGCGQKEAAAPSQAPVKVYEFKMHHHDPPNSAIGQYFDNWAKEIGAKSNGRIKITVYPGSSLGPAPQAYNMVSTGIADIAWGYVGMFPGQFLGSEILQLPMLGIQSAKMGGSVLWDMYKNTEFLKKEYQSVQVLYLFTEGGTPIGTKSKKIATVADMQGLKLRSPGGPVMEFLKKTGATPIGMPPGEMYESLGKGVIDGYLIGWQGVAAFKLLENTKYVLNSNLYTSTFWVVMNKNKYNTLPDDLKKVMDEMSGEAAMLKMAQTIDGVEKKLVDEMAKANVEKVELSAAEQKKWAELAQEVQDKWVADATAKGFPAKEALAKAKEIIAKNAGK